MFAGAVAASRRRSSSPASLSAPTLTVTSAAGDIPTFTVTMGTDIYEGYELRIQRATTNGKDGTGAYSSPVVNLVHELTPSEHAALAIPKANLVPDGWIDPSGAWYIQARWERADGATSAWSNEISGTVVVSSAELVSTDGANKSQYVAVSGSPKKLTFTGTSGVGAPCQVRSTVSATGKRQFEVTITTLNGNFYVGINDGATAIGPAVFPTLGSSSNTGITLQMSSASSGINKNPTGTQSGLAGIAAGDVITCEFDTTAGTASFYRTRSGTTVQLGTTVTGITFATPWYVHVGTSQDGVGTVNFGASAFTRALSSGYTFFG